MATYMKNGVKELKLLAIKYLENRHTGEYIAEIVLETFTKYGFTNQEIQHLKKSYKFLFILDGYDELVDYPNIYDENELKEWDARVIIATRHNYFSRFRHGHEPYLYPHDENDNIQRTFVKELYVKPFDEEQRKQYIQLHI